MDGEERRAGEPALTAQVAASAEALAFVREAYGLDEDTAISLDALLKACILGNPATVERLKASFQEVPVLTLEAIEAQLIQLRDNQEQAFHRLARMSVQAKQATHSLEQCAQAILGRTTPQVIEQMEITMQATARQAWEVIAGTLIMWRNDLLGADFTEVQPEGAALPVGQSLWSPVQAPAVRTQAASVLMAVCETCGQAFAPGPNQHRPRFGCPACGAVETLKQKNALEQKRAAENPEYKATIRPETLDYAMYQMGLGKCTCGQAPEVTQPAA